MNVQKEYAQALSYKALTLIPSLQSLLMATICCEHVIGQEHPYLTLMKIPDRCHKRISIIPSWDKCEYSLAGVKKKMR